MAALALGGADARAGPAMSLRATMLAVDVASSGVWNVDCCGRNRINIADHQLQLPEGLRQR